MKKQPPPAELKTAGKRFWKKIMSEFEISEGHDLARLSMAAGCLDSIAAAEEVLKAEGIFTKDRYGGVKENPAAKAIREEKIIFARLIRELGFGLEGAKDSRPPRQY